MAPGARDAGPGSLDEALEWFRKRFDAGAAGDLAVTYGFELAGEGGGRLVLRIGAGRLDARRGEPVDAQVVFRMEAGDLFAIQSGRANVDMLFMEDRIQVVGDLSLALKLRRIFRRQA